MRGGLHASNTAHLPPSAPAYYDLADIFHGALRRDLPRVFPDGEVSYVGIGALTQQIGSKIFVSGLLADFPAGQAGLRPGDQILAADGARFDPLESFPGKGGPSVTLT